MLLNLLNKDPLSIAKNPVKKLFPKSVCRTEIYGKLSRKHNFEKILLQLLFNNLFMIHFQNIYSYVYMYVFKLINLLLPFESYIDYLCDVLIY